MAIEKADDQEHQREHGIEPARRLGLVGLVPEQVLDDELRARELEHDDRPRAEGDERERDRAVEVGVVRADPRAGEMEMPVDHLAPAHGAHAREQPHPVMKQDEDEESHQ
jgi:hypothetical protein